MLSTHRSNTPFFALDNFKHILGPINEIKDFKKYGSKTQKQESVEASRWIKESDTIQDVIKSLIASNSSQSQDNKSLFKHRDLKTLYLDVHSRHNCVYDNPIRLMHHKSKRIH